MSHGNEEINHKLRFNAYSDTYNIFIFFNRNQNNNKNKIILVSIKKDESVIFGHPVVRQTIDFQIFLSTEALQHIHWLKLNSTIPLMSHFQILWL